MGSADGSILDSACNDVLAWHWMEHERSLGFYVGVLGGFLPAGSQYLGSRAATLSITYQALNVEGLNGKNLHLQ